MRSCIICGKPLGVDKVPGLKACKKHQHILDTVVTNREHQADLTHLSYMNLNGDEVRIRTLGDFQDACMQNAIFVLGIPKETVFILG